MIQSGYKPAQQVKPSEFFSVPFNEMYTGLANKQRYYDIMDEKAAKAAEGLQGMLKNVDIYDSSEASGRVLAFQQNLDAIKEKYPDYTDPMFKKELNKIITTETADPWWTTAFAAKPIYEQWRTAVSDSQAPIQNKVEAMRLIEQAATAPKGATNLFAGTGKLTPLNIPEYSDWGKATQDVANMVTADANSGYKIGDAWITTSSWEGISQAKVLQALGVNYKTDAKGQLVDASGNVITDFKTQAPVLDLENVNINLAAPEMEQLARDARYIASTDPRGITPEIAAAELYVNKAIQLANAKAFEKTDSDVKANPYKQDEIDFQQQLAIRAMDKADEEAKEQDTTPNQIVYGNKGFESLPEKATMVTSTEQKLLDIYHDPNSSAKEKERAARTLELNGIKVNGVALPSDTSQAGLTKYATELQNTGNEADAFMGKTLANIIKANPQKKGESSKDYNARVDAAYQSFRNTFKETELNYNQYSDKNTITKETGKWIGTVSGEAKDKKAAPGVIVNKAIIVVDPVTGASKQMSYKSFLDFLDDDGSLDPADFVSNSTINGPVDPVNDFSPSGVMGTYMDKKGNKVNFVITDENYSESVNNQGVYTLSEPMFSPMSTSSKPVSTGALRLSETGRKYLELGENDKVITKRQDVFENGEYTSELLMYKQVGNHTVPLTIGGEHVTHGEFMQLYNSMK